MGNPPRPPQAKRVEKIWKRIFSVILGRRGGLDKWRSRNYFWVRNQKKGVIDYGKGINDLETIF
jgi:hypothetical protein